MKKLILATLTVAALTGFAFESSIGGTCPSAGCEEPKKIAISTYTYKGSDEQNNIAADEICSGTGCQDLLATTCSGSDADCSVKKNKTTVSSAPCTEEVCQDTKKPSVAAGCGDPMCCGGGPKFTASIIIHCSETSSFGGCVDSDATVASFMPKCSETTSSFGCVDGTQA